MKRNYQKSELKAWQQEDAERLKDLLDSRRKRSDWPGQPAFAESVLGKTSSFLSQLASGGRRLNEDNVVALARGLGVKVKDISPTLAAQIAAKARGLGSPPEPDRRNSNAEITHGPTGPNRYALHGMQISTEEVEVGIEWGKLDEPMRTQYREMLLLAVATQVRQRRAKKPANDKATDKKH